MPLHEMVLSGPEGMLRRAPSRRRGAVESEEERLVVEEVKETGISVITDSPSLGIFLSASGLQACAASASHRRSRRLAVWFLQERAVSNGVTRVCRGGTHKAPEKGLWARDWETLRAGFEAGDFWLDLALTAVLGPLMSSRAASFLLSLLLFGLTSVPARGGAFDEEVTPALEDP